MEPPALEKGRPCVRVPDEIMGLVLSTPPTLTFQSSLVYTLNAITYLLLHLRYHIIFAEIIEDHLQEAQAGPVCIIRGSFLFL